MTNTLAITYPPDYPEKCFMVWYSLGCPNISVKILQKFPELDGHRPIANTIRKWMEEHNWKQHAAELDAKARELVDHKLVKQKAEMLERHAREARQIQAEALKHMLDGFDSSASAVRAYADSVELERTSLGLSEAILKLSKMGEKELNTTLKNLLERATEGVIDTAEVEDTEENGEENETTQGS